MSGTAPRFAMPHLVAHLPDRTARSRLAQALEPGTVPSRRAPATPSFHNSWDELYEAIRDTAPAVAVFDPYTPSGSLAVDAVQSLTGGFGSLTMIGYADFGDRLSRDVMKLAKLGVAEVIDEGVDDDPRTLRQLIDTAVIEATAAPVLDVLGNRIPDPLQPVVRFALANAYRPVRPADLARRVHCTPRHLRRQLIEAGLPSPNRLIVWMRVLRAVQLLQDPARTVQGVASALGFGCERGRRAQFGRIFETRNIN